MNEDRQPEAHEDRPAVEQSAADLPRPIIKKMRWPFPFIWIVPIVAAGVAGYLLYQQHQEFGLEVMVEFPDGSGIKPGQTQVQMHGVRVGTVQKLTLSADHQHAVAHLKLATEEACLARAGTLFWIVKPEVSLGNVTGLNTIFSGSYIEALPGEGSASHYFTGLLEAPKIQGPGIRVILHADRLGSVTNESPVTYLDVQVGIVDDIRLSDDGDTADITLFIWGRYSPLVRENSVFWEVKAADVKGGIFSGVKVKLDSLKSLLTGAISFATPEKSVGAPAPGGSQFFLYAQPAEDWLKWRPKIRLLSADAAPPPTATGQGHEALPIPRHE